MLLAHALGFGRRGPVRQNLDLVALAEHLGNELELRCSAYSDIVLVGHSMGGLVAKTLLALRHQLPPPATFHLLTLATPHVGIPSLVLPAFSRWIGNPQLRDVASFNNTLSSVNERWAERRHLFGYQYIYGHHDTLVPPNLAIPQEERNRAIAVDQDHFSIARPPDESVDTVLHLRDYLYAASTVIQLQDVPSEQLERLAQELWQREDRSTAATAIEILIAAEDSRDLAQLPTLRRAPDHLYLLVARHNIAEGALARLHGQANRNGASLIVWDRTRLKELLDRHPDLAAKYELVRRLSRNLVLPSPSFAPDLSVLAQEDFVNRTKERATIASFCQSVDKTLLLVVGQGGVGKTALAAQTLLSLHDEFDASGGLRISRRTNRTDIFEGLRLILNRAGVTAFDRFSRNSHFSDTQRVAVLCEILSSKRLLLVIDNLEEAIDEQRQVTLHILATILESVTKTRMGSKVLVTSRIVPDAAFADTACTQIMPVAPFSAATLASEYLPRLPHLQAIEGLSIERVHAMTGGNPLMLQILNSYVTQSTLEHAYDRSVESLFEALVGDLYSRVGSACKRLLLLIALADEGVTGLWLQELSVGTDVLNEALDGGLIEFNIRDQTYSIHPVIRSRLLKECTDPHAMELHREIASCYGGLHLDLHLDHEVRHLLERKRVRHLVAAGELEAATEALGRIGTRYLSFNSTEELAALVDTLDGASDSARARFWIANLRAHIQDFWRNFEVSAPIYREQLAIARTQGDKRLMGLATNNVGTTYRRRGNLADAVRWYLRAYRLAVREDDQKLQGTTLNNLGQTYGYLGRIDIATRTLERAAQLRSSQRDEFRLAATLSHLGSLCLQQAVRVADTASVESTEALDRAYLLLARSIELQRKQSNYWMLDRTYREMSRYWCIQQQEERAEKYRRLARSVLDTKAVFVEPRFF